MMPHPRHRVQQSLFVATERRQVEEDVGADEVIGDAVDGGDQRG
jgi:hypothetical protein